MKAYPNYKYSGVPWLGDVPEHWKVLRLGSQFIERKQKVSDKDFAPLSVTKKGILPQLDTAAKSNDGDNRKKVCSGDFVINSRSDRKGSSGVSPYTGSVSLINTVLTPISFDRRFVHNFFRSHIFQEEFYRVGRGIVADLWSTKYADMRTIMIPVPLLDEQQQIARYLDWQTSKINKFIKAKKKLITLLKEQKNSVIDVAVFKGINPSIRMKESHIEWLGTIPDHWVVRKIKQVARFNPSKSESTKNASLSSMITFLPMEKISTDGEISCDLRLPLSKVIQGFTYFRRNDVIVAKITPCFENGKGAFLNNLDSEFGFGTTELFVLRPQSQIIGEYLRLVLRSAKFLRLGEQHMSGAAGQQRVQSSFIKNFEIGLPPIKEQRAIVSFIQNELETINYTIYRTNREIELIQEYRTRLVSDVVTGKIDVRAVKIPDFEPAETELEVKEDEEFEELIAEGIEE